MGPLDLNSASQENNVPGALQKMLLERIHNAPQMEQLTAARKGALNDYQSMLRGNPSGTYTPTEHSLYTNVANMGRMPAMTALTTGIGAGGDFIKNNQEQRFKNRVAAEQVGYADALKDETQADSELKALSSLARTGAKGAGSFIQFKDDKGNLYIMNKVTGERELIPASGAPVWDKVYRQAFDKLTAEDDPEAHDKAVMFANSALKRSPLGVTSTDTTQKPTESVGRVPATTLAIGNQNPEAEKLIIEQFRKALNLSQNPETQEQGRSQLSALQQLYPESGAPRMQYLDKREVKRNEGYGGAEGSGLFKERQSLSELYGKNSQLISNLTNMSQVYADPNIPEGKLGPLIQDFRSGLKGLGIEVDKSTPNAQVFDAMAKKLALGMKSADGTNLLPGAMSNYEDQLLQSIAPGLSGTREGNIKLMNLMIEIAKSNMRLADEGTKMASGNKDMLPSSWYQRKERVMLEEMARLKEIAQGLR